MANKMRKTAQFIIFCIFFLGLLGGGFYFMQAKTDIFSVSAYSASDKEVVPDEKISIIFSQAVDPGSYSGKIKMVPENNFTASWENGNRTLVIAPQKYWLPETKYAIEIGEGRSKFFTSIKKQVFNFSTIAYPVVGKVIPASGAIDVVVGAEDPIVVRFDKSFEKFYIRFDFDPVSDIAYQINPEKTEFKILPKQPLKDGKKYVLNVSAKYIKDSDETYHKIFSSNFVTPVAAVAPVVWEKDLSLRVQQAKQFTKPRIIEGKYIDVNLATQIMTIFENGTVLDAYAVSSGKKGMDTPAGTYKIENKAPRPWSAAYGLFMPNWMALVPSGKFGIHELPEWPGGYKEGQNHLGTPVSHGCVRLGVGAAKRVYDWAELGTPVVVY